MVVIRLSRGGAKKRPFYHVIVTDSRKRRDTGSCISRIGYFNPSARGQEVRLQIDLNEVNKWVETGAQLSKRVQELVKQYNKQVAAEA